MVAKKNQTAPPSGFAAAGPMVPSTSTSAGPSAPLAFAAVKVLCQRARRLLPKWRQSLTASPRRPPSFSLLASTLLVALFRRMGESRGMLVPLKPDRGEGHSLSQFVVGTPWDFVCSLEGADKLPSPLEPNGVQNFLDPLLDGLSWDRAEMLGLVYEAMLDADAEAPGRKRGGSFYTPPSLVEDLLQATLEPLFEQCRVAGRPLESLRLVDPACGGGNLLLAAGRRLLERWQAAHPLSTPPEVATARHHLYRQCLFGVDRDPMAVACCQAALWLDAGDTRWSRNQLAQSVQCGNSLLGADFQSEPVVTGTRSSQVLDDWCAERLRDQKDQEPRPKGRRERADAPKFFHWPLAFPQIAPSETSSRERMGFDGVLANPPYLASYSRQSAHAQNKSASKADPHSSDRLFPAFDPFHGSLAGLPVVTGRRNLFLYFLTLATKLIGADGRIGMIVPDALLTNESYEPMRRGLLQTGALREVHLYRSPLFAGATVGTALVVASSPSQRASRDRSAQSVVLRLVDNDVGTTQVRAKGESGEQSLAIQQLLARPGLNLQPSLRAGRATGPRSRATAACRVTLGELTKIRDGINPGTRDVRDRLVARTKREQFANPCRLIEGKDIQPYVVNWSGMWIDYSPEQLSPAEKKKGASLRAPWIFTGPKLVYRQTATHPIVAVDLEGHFALNSVHAIVPENEDIALLWGLAAYLNSKPLRELYQRTTGETRRVFPQVHASSMRQLPIPDRLMDGQDPLRAELETLARQAALLDAEDARWRQCQQKMDSLCHQLLWPSRRRKSA